MSKNVITIIKKELRRFFTDRRMLVSLLLPGIIIFVLYSFMGNMTERMIGVEDDYIYQVVVINEPTELASFHQTAAFDIEVRYEASITDADLLLLEEKDIDLIIFYETDFYQKVLNYDINDGLAPKVELYYNSTKNESSNIYGFYNMAINNFEMTLANRLDINRDANIEYDLATEDDTSIQFITSLLPFLLLTFLFSGAMSVAAESIAGEKERGTFATLLITPTKKSEIALGKIIALSIITLVSAASSFTGLMLSLPKLMGGNVSMAMYGFGTYALLFIVIISTVLIYVVILSIISAYAKSIKEASSLAVPLMLVNMLVGISSMLGMANESLYMYFIPIYNSVQSITGILSLEIDMINLTITILMNLLVVGLGVLGLTKMFNSEKIMFNK